MDMPPVVPFADVDYGNFQPTSSVLRAAAALENANKNKTMWQLMQSDTALQYLVSHLETMGFRRVNTDIKRGGCALVLEGSNHQMLRIVKDNIEAPRLKKPYVLEALYSYPVVSGYHIEVLPKVHTLEQVIDSDELSAQYGITQLVKQVDALTRGLIEDALAEGKFFCDPHMANIGLIKGANGRTVPIIIDAGSVVDIDKMTYVDVLNFAKWLPEGKQTERNCSDLMSTLRMDDDARKAAIMKAMKPIGPREKEPMPYAQAQAAHRNNLALHCGGANHVLREEDLEEFVHQRNSIAGIAGNMTHAKTPVQTNTYNPQQSLFVQMVRKDGLYPSEIATLHKEAAAAHKHGVDEGTNVKGYCEHVKDRRDAMIKTRGVGEA